MCIFKGRIGFSKSSEKSSRSVKFSFFKIWSADAMNQLTQRDQFKSSRLLCAILQLSDFLEWALFQSWLPLLFSRGLKTIAHSPKVRHFQFQQLLAVFKSKRTVVLVYRF